ncbi:MAG TPA: bacterial transcriptional activator domain-containing protein, partial [Polyangia bacterium]|nr:bacterial transcriptional activator domain-containing protein [Polyangia bacterium]
AQRALQEAYRVDARSVPVLRAIGVMMHAKGSSAEAIQWLQGAAAIDPSDAETRYQLAACYAAQGRRNEAMVEYGVVCNLDGALATKLYYLLGGR